MTAGRPPRPRRIYDVFELRCACGKVVELPVHSVVDGIGCCGFCGRELVILWRRPLQ
jgi:hypothetical protein